MHLPFHIIIYHLMHRWPRHWLAQNFCTIRLNQCYRGVFARHRRHWCVPLISLTAVAAPNHLTEVQYFLAISSTSRRFHPAFPRTVYDCCHCSGRIAENFAAQVLHSVPSIGSCRTAQSCHRGRSDRCAEADRHARNARTNCPIDRTERSRLGCVQYDRKASTLPAVPTIRTTVATNSPRRHDLLADYSRFSVCGRHSFQSQLRSPPYQIYPAKLSPESLNSSPFFESCVRASIPFDDWSREEWKNERTYLDSSQSGRN